MKNVLTGMSCAYCFSLPLCITFFNSPVSAGYLPTSSFYLKITN